MQQPEAILDGNVKRVLCRLFAIAQPLNQAATLKQLWSLSERLTNSVAVGFNRCLHPRYHGFRSDCVQAKPTRVSTLSIDESLLSLSASAAIQFARSHQAGTQTHSPSDLNLGTILNSPKTDRLNHSKAIIAVEATAQFRHMGRFMESTNA